jgi:hypothetical protein
VSALRVTSPLIVGQDVPEFLVCGDPNEQPFA